jgi:outer membrane protein assembly factor BamB
VASQDGRLTLLDLDSGEPRWSFDAGSAIAGTPAVAGGWVLIASEDGRIWAFSGPVAEGERRRAAGA